MNPKPITIIGGGLAGLTLGIGLRGRGVPVTLCEAGRYPRHRVCGEFVSGRGRETLARLGLLELLKQAGAGEALTAEFCTARTAGKIHALPQPALCLSRHKMDALLCARFCELGGELREGERWRGDGAQEGVVLATGRRLQPVVGGRRWFGLKAHALGVKMEADLEIHVSRDGYVGLCRQPAGVVNVCGLFHRQAGCEAGDALSPESLRGAEGSLLAERMHGAVFVPETFCAVAGINLNPQRAAAHPECRVGDAVTMIPPLTGNGMSIAFETAEIAIQPLTAWSRGEIAWSGAREMIASRCDERLGSRLRWAGWIQRAALSPAWQGLLLRITSRSEAAWRGLFERTR